jgi:hypothetical protein
MFELLALCDTFTVVKFHKQYISEACVLTCTKEQTINDYITLYKQYRNAIVSETCVKGLFEWGDVVTYLIKTKIII